MNDIKNIVMTNTNYQWQNKRKNYIPPTWMQAEINSRRKQLNKKLKAIQDKPSECIHEMDDVMFNSVCQMLKSETTTDIEMAIDIIMHSKMSLTQIHSFTNNEYYCRVILQGPIIYLNTPF